MKLICCNFKMNLLKKDIENYLNEINNKISNNIIFFPSIPYINDFYKNNYTVGCQNISFKEFGSITGDTSLSQLKELGVTYTIIGHSERREYFNDNKFIEKKINLALTNNLKVILCIGEKNQNEKKEEFLKQEIDEAFKNNKDLINNDNLIIAYEPIWSIGSGLIPTNKCLEDTISYIKDYILDNYNLKTKVLYGGSVNLENINKLEEINNIDGYLIGGASLKPDNVIKFSNIIK